MYQREWRRQHSWLPNLQVGKTDAPSVIPRHLSREPASGWRQIDDIGPLQLWKGQHLLSRLLWIPRPSSCQTQHLCALGMLALFSTALTTGLLQPLTNGGGSHSSLILGVSSAPRCSGPTRMAEWPCKGQLNGNTWHGRSKGHRITMLV